MKSIPRLHLPLRQPEDVIPHLGAPHHWQPGRSARLIAEAWFAENGLPIMVRETLKTTPALADAELVDGFLERSVDLGDGRRPSQADLLAILGIGDQLAVMAVEGKVDETFGPLVSEWLLDASQAKVARLAGLCAWLGIDPAAAGPLRYQLLHRTASAMIEARRYRAQTAIMMVHSFDPRDAGLEDYLRFAFAIGIADAKATRCAGPLHSQGINLFLGWAADRPSNEGFSIVDGRKTDAGFHGDID